MTLTLGALLAAPVSAATLTRGPYLQLLTVYSSFGTDYTTLGVKPVDDGHASAYQNGDHAGTPGFLQRQGDGALSVS